LVADERFETIAHATLNRADCAQRLATVLSRIASGADQCTNQFSRRFFVALRHPIIG